MRLPLKQAALLIGVAAASAAPFPVREDEFECEEAVAHLDGCCDEFPSHEVACEYEAGCGDTTWPDLSVDEADCIQALACDEVRARGLCDEVPTLERRGVVDGGVLPRSTVCP